MPAIITARTRELNSKDMYEPRLVQDFSGGGKGTSDMIIRTNSTSHGITRECSERNLTRHPVTKNNLCWVGLGTILRIELDMKMIPFHKSINCYPFILIISITFSGNHKGDLTALKVEINGRKNCDESELGICRIVGTVLRLDIPIEIAFWNTVPIHIR